MGQNKSRYIHWKTSWLHHRCEKFAKLINHEGIDVNTLVSTEDYDNVTPLWLASRYDECELAEFFISLGANTNVACGGLRMTPLHIACYNRSLRLVELLLNNGANPNVLDKWNYSPLMYASIHEDSTRVAELFQLLIHHGSDVNFGALLNTDGTLKMEANTELVSLRSVFDGDFVAYCREPMGPTSGTALHLAALNPHMSGDVFEILLDADCDINAVNLHGQTALMGAVLDTYYDYHPNIKEHTQLLIQRGCDINVRDSRGWTCFHYACQRGNTTCMELLLSVGANCEAKGDQGETPLWVLLTHGWCDAVRCLLMNGCDMDLTLTSSTILNLNQNVDICRYGTILPVEFALANKYYDVALLLVELGCEINSRIWVGNSSYANNENYQAFVRKLKERLATQNKVKNLQELCRDVTRKILHRAICVKVKNMSLPRFIADYVCYNC